MSGTTPTLLADGLTKRLDAPEARAWISAPSWADLGWHPLSQTCLGLQILLFGASLALYRATDIDVRWSTDRAFLTFVAELAALWIALALLSPKRLLLRRFTEAIAAVVLFLLLIQITAPMQYGAMALGRPLIDSWLDRADHWLGIDVARLTMWTAQYPWLVATLNASYESLAPQLMVTLIVLPMTRDREALWEYLWHLHVSLIGALICLALWPTVYVFTYRHFDPLVSPEAVRHVMSQVWELRAGRFHAVTLPDMQGLISFPSFHTAAAFAVVWALRRQRLWIWLPVVVLNVGLVSATVLLGLHYVTDLLGTAVLLAMSLLIYRRVFAKRTATSASAAPLAF